MLTVSSRWIREKQFRMYRPVLTSGIQEGMPPPYRHFRLTVNISPAHKTPPRCPTGPSITCLYVIAAALLPLLCEPISQSVPSRAKQQIISFLTNIGPQEQLGSIPCLSCILLSLSRPSPLLLDPAEAQPAPRPARRGPRDQKRSHWDGWMKGEGGGSANICLLASSSLNTKQSRQNSDRKTQKPMGSPQKQLKLRSAKILHTVENSVTSIPEHRKVQNNRHPDRLKRWKGNYLTATAATFRLFLSPKPGSIDPIWQIGMGQVAKPANQLMLRDVSRTAGSGGDARGRDDRSDQAFQNPSVAGFFFFFFFFFFLAHEA
jgi:hypothetical protein